VIDRLTSLVLLAATGVTAAAAHLQIAEALDYVVHVDRRDGRRRLQAVGEVRRTPDGLTVVPLFARTEDGVVAVDRPARAPRRPDAPPPDPEWFPC
jgi:Flp pilus assembly CpaF family ATPase